MRSWRSSVRLSRTKTMPSARCSAALRILAAIDELNAEHPDLELAVRGAVNSGEAMVTLSARPAEGEGMVAGDVVNTAARLQQHAPVGGIVVGEGTYRVTREALRIRAPRAGHREGQGRSAAALARNRAAQALRCRRRAHRPDTAHRSRRRPRAAAVHVRAHAAGCLDPAADDHRRAGRRQDAADGRVSALGGRPARDRLLAAGPLASLWGGHHVLGAGRDDQGAGRDPRIGQPRGCRSEAGRRRR